MSYQAIRDALATRLETVVGVGTVHTYERYLTEQAEVAAFQAAFSKNGVLNTWMIERRAVSSRQSAAADAKRIRRHTLRLEGFYSLKDAAASKLTFQDLIDAVCDDLETGDRTLGGACLTHSLPSVDTIEETLFAGVLCHRTEIQIIVEEVNPMYRVIDSVLHASSQVTGSGSEVKGDWVDVREFVSGHIFIDVSAIDAATTAAFTVDFANEDKSIAVSSGLSVSNMLATGQQLVAVSSVPAWMRLNHNVTNGKHVTYKAVFSGRGLY